MFNFSTGAAQTVAATGNSQATGATLKHGVNRVTAADGTKAVVLPALNDGDAVVVNNTVAAVLPVFPDVGGSINGGAANAALNMAASTKAIYFLESGALTGVRVWTRILSA
jgi:hypothetical protein